MSNADQLKYMRTSTQSKEPRAITYPLPARVPGLTREDVQRIVWEKVSEILYAVLRSEEDIDIASMSLADFDAFLQRIMCSDEVEV